MSKGFLYYAPNHPRVVVKAADLPALGLAHVAADGDPDSRPTKEGPDGAAGVVFGYGVEHSATKWVKGAGGKYWVGYDPAAMPGPDDLRQAKSYVGNAVRLADGNDWNVPACHVPAFITDHRSSLPMMIGLADDGETPTVRPHPRYLDLCERAQKQWLQFAGMATEAESLDGPAQVRLSVDALSVNYRVGPVEAVGILGLFGEDELLAVLRAVVDADACEAWAKAKEGEAASPKE